MRLKKCMTKLLLLLAAAWCLTGCSASKDSLEEIQIKELGNHLEQWQQELPQDTEFGGIGANEIRGLKVQKKGETVFAVSYEPREGKETFDYWDISVPYHSLVSVNTEELYNLLGTAALMVWGEADGISIEEAGIKDSDTSVFLAYCKQSQGEKGGAEPTGAQSILIGNTDGKGSYYAALEGSSKVGLVNQILMDEILNVEPYEYILKIPTLISVDTVKKVQIFTGEESHVMEQDEEGWKMDGEKVSQKDYQSLYGALLDVMLTGELDENVKAEKEREPFLTLQFIRKQEDISDVEVKYYSYDEEHMSVSVNGQENFLVEKDAVFTLKERIETGI
ncbi:MAG: DUF4340 domain-containing protein [Lachnospiraceae bacterium]|nr:DUF4340 domain-containing protein [Lachnospiraceae bacterium]